MRQELKFKLIGESFLNSIKLFQPLFRKEEVLEEIEDCLDKGWTGIGYKTDQFEELWCEYTKLKNCHFL